MRRHTAALAAYDAACRDRAAAMAEAKAAGEAVVVGQQVAQAVQEQAHTRIANVVSRCLAVIFDEPYEFAIAFERRRGRTEAILQLVRDGNTIDDPLDASGGGAVDVAAFALRVAALVLAAPAGRRVLVMDEPFRFLKPPEYYAPRVCELLETLSREMGIQFIIVQNVPEFRTGTLFEVP